MSRFSVQNILSHSAENFRRGPLLCCVSEKYRLPKSLRIRERGKYKDFQSKFFVPMCRKSSWGNSSVCHYIRVSKKFE